ncbi:F-box/LRR-repeat protein 12 isoform X1 [Bufo gargarizans]|uniref:F-box/LRR-repeat protein 12 isoform X1 n=1 Tax=Bufo gargarizans TaxID=30331 RepID=UPI001CF1FC82|nr:F-box/LRR-repeat protein 12 isoform X1 [Bufo gargarizans]
MEMVKMSAAGYCGETSNGLSVTTSLSWLPDSVLLEVLSFLSVRDLIRSGRVCKRWKRLVLDKSLWRYVDLTPYKLNSKILWHLLRHWIGTSLQTFKLKGLLNSVKKQEFLTPAILQVLEKRYPSLEHLHLQETNLRSLSYDCLPSTLKTLELSECEIPLTWFKSSTSKTKGFLKLENLVLNKVSSFSNHHLETICSQSSLKTLCLCGTYRVNDIGIQKAVPYLKGLEHFKLKECNITNITLHLIGCHLKNLRTLALLGFREFTDTGLRCVSGVKTLEKLWLDDCFGFSSRTIIAVCVSLPVLNCLGLNEMFFECQGIDKIRKSLPHCIVTNAFSNMDNVPKNGSTGIV